MGEDGARRDRADAARLADLFARTFAESEPVVITGEETEERLRRFANFVGCTAMAVSVSFAMPSARAWAAPYANPDFYFSMSLPDHFTACQQVSGLDHGPLIALERPRPGRCDEDDLGRYMGFFAYSNAADNERTFGGFVRSSCTDKTGKYTCQKIDLGLRIGTLKTAEFRERARKGKISILVLAQNRTGPLLSCATGVNYNADLLTDPAHYRQDVAEFRRFLASVRTTPPPEDHKACEPAHPSALKP